MIDPKNVLKLENTHPYNPKSYTPPTRQERPSPPPPPPPPFKVMNEAGIKREERNNEVKKC